LRGARADQFATAEPRLQKFGRALGCRPALDLKCPVGSASLARRDFGCYGTGKKNWGKDAFGGPDVGSGAGGDWLGRTTGGGRATCKYRKGPTGKQKKAGLGRGPAGRWAGGGGKPGEVLFGGGGN